MNTKDIAKERICGFYASDIHFEIMILPYINKKLEQKEKIYLINDKNLEESINKVIDKMNLEENKKKNILKLGWDNQNDKKIKQINEENGKVTIIINGSDTFNRAVNNKIKIKENFKMINCYNLEETEDIETIKSNYTKIINSSGIKEFI